MSRHKIDTSGTRVAVVLFGTSGRGGMESSIQLLAKGLALTGNEVHLFLLGGSEDRTWLENLPATTIGDPAQTRISRYARYVLRFPYHFRRFRPAAVLCADPRAVFVARLLRQLTLHKFSILAWPHFALTDLADYRLMRGADHYLAISTPIAEQLHERLNLPATRITIVHNPIDTDVVGLTFPLKPTFAIIGRLQVGRQKRTDDVLKAASALLGDFAIHIVGDGADVPRLHDLARRLGVAERIRWHGWSDDPWSVLGPVTYTVLTSSYEGYPMVLLESMARGIPVISSNCKSGPDELVSPGVNGWLYPVGDIRSLRQVMQKVVDGKAQTSAASRIRDSVASHGVIPTANRVNAAMAACVDPRHKRRVER